MESATDTVSQYSQRAGGILQDAAASVTEGLKESAEYLRGEGISGVVEDMATIIRVIRFRRWSLGLESDFSCPGDAGGCYDE